MTTFSSPFPLLSSINLCFLQRIYLQIRGTDLASAEKEAHVALGLSKKCGN
eukprot:c53543_g1_i1 orf=114-266(+)